MSRYSREGVVMKLQYILVVVVVSDNVTKKNRTFSCCSDLLISSSVSPHHGRILMSYFLYSFVATSENYLGLTTILLLYVHRTTSSRQSRYRYATVICNAVESGKPTLFQPIGTIEIVNFLS